MLGNSWFKKESPLLGWFGIGGGLASSSTLPNVDASGGTTFEYNGKKIHRFTYPNSDAFVVNRYTDPFTLEYVIIAGGGGAGCYNSPQRGGGGGGAGAVRIDQFTYDIPIGTYPVTVGNGGDGGSHSGSEGPGYPQQYGEKGDASSLGFPTPKQPPLGQADPRPGPANNFYTEGGGYGGKGGPGGPKGYGGSYGGSGGTTGQGASNPTNLFNPNPLFLPNPAPTADPTSPNNTCRWKWAGGNPSYGGSNGPFDDAVRGYYGMRGGGAENNRGGGGGGASGQGGNAGPTEPAGRGGSGLRLPATFRDPTNPLGAPGTDPVFGSGAWWVAGGGAGTPGGDVINGGGNASGGSGGTPGGASTGGGGGAGLPHGGDGGTGQVLIAYPM
tara:strand:+ start:863 stop:2014 length:1152 start_codon:yes stop_codon:yes gene_type:complete